MSWLEEYFLNCKELGLAPCMTNGIILLLLITLLVGFILAIYFSLKNSELVRGEYGK